MSQSPALSQTPPDKSAYWFALGQFIDWFANLESMVLGLLTVEARTKSPESQAIFSGVKIDQARDYINRLYDARQKKRPAILVEAFEHVGLLTKARNDLVHLGAVLPADDGKGFTVHNWRQAHIASKYRAWTVTTDLLLDMTHDTKRAWYMIGAVILGPKAHKDLPFLLESSELGPWRYKQPPPSVPDPMPPWLLPKPKRQRASSQASPSKKAGKRGRKGSTKP